MLKKFLYDLYLAGVHSVPERGMRVAFQNVGAAIEEERHQFHITSSCKLNATACANQRRYTAIISGLDVGTEI